MAPPLPPLSREQVSRFKTLGFLIIPPGALDEELLAAAQDMMWADEQCGLAKVPRLERDDPTSWSGGFTDAEVGVLLLLCIFGALVWASVLAAFVDIVTNIDPDKRAFRLAKDFEYRGHFPCSASAPPVGAGRA